MAHRVQETSHEMALKKVGKGAAALMEQS